MHGDALAVELFYTGGRFIAYVNVAIFVGCHSVWWPQFVNVRMTLRVISYLSAGSRACQVSNHNGQKAQWNSAMSSRPHSCSKPSKRTFKKRWKRVFSHR